MERLTDGQRASILGAAIDYAQAGSSRAAIDKATELMVIIEAIRATDERERGITPITIETRHPDTWRFCDLESGQSWRWDRSGEFARFVRTDDDHEVR